MDKHTPQDTIAYMNGHWGAARKEGEVLYEYSLKITNEEVELIIKKDGIVVTKERFENSAHWLEQYLFFWGTSKYFLTYADSNVMNFGELDTPGNFKGKYKYFLKFTRIP